MRIMHIGNVQRRANGVGQVISALSKSQKSQGHEVLSLTARHKQDELDEYIEVHSPKDFNRLLDEFEPDIFIFHSLFIWEYIRFYQILNRRKIPFLIQLHGALSEKNYQKNHLKKWAALTLFYKRFIKSAKKIIYLNKGEYGKSIVPRINKNYAIIPNGCVLPASSPKREELGKRRIEFLYLGRIEIYHKALDVLIKALSIIKNSPIADKVHFSFYGIGEESHIEHFKQLIAGVSEIAVFKGAAYGKDKEKAFSESDIFLLTSRSEGMPMAVLEALAYGLPCFVTPATNMVDIMREYNCGFVSELDAQRLAQDLIKAVNHFENNQPQLSDNSLMAAKAYSWDQIAYQTIELYKDVINTNNL